MAKRRIHRDRLQATPWKNGGGTTREIALSPTGTPFWRLSIADVAVDGRFSSFPGLSRILTVIEGDGMVLRAPDKTLNARHLDPVAFSGDDVIVGELTQGPIQDLNLIYDAGCWQAQVIAGAFETIFHKFWKTTDLSFIYCSSGFVVLKDDGFVNAHEGILDIQSSDILEGASAGTCVWIALKQGNNAIGPADD